MSNLRAVSSYGRKKGVIKTGGRNYKKERKRLGMTVNKGVGIKKDDLAM